MLIFRTANGGSMRPYIGITDFTSVDDVRAMLGVFNRHGPLSDYLLHVGVMMSHKTLWGIPSRWAGIFPKHDELPRIFGVKDDRVYNCLHFADDENEPKLSASLAKAVALCGPYLHAVQLDMTWPNPEQVGRGIEQSGKDIEVILQIGRRAVEQAEYSADAVIGRLRPYRGVIHRVLLDMSMGRGVPMQPHILIPFARAVQEEFPQWGITVAGGLGPHTMHLVESIRKEIPGVSVDAQGRLRPSGSCVDPIDWDIAAEYLKAALMTLSETT